MLGDAGVERGSRVGIILPQRPETLFANIAILHRGAVSVPLTVLYGRKGIRYLLDHSEREVAIGDEKRMELLDSLGDEPDRLKTVITIDDPEAIEGKSWKDSVSDTSPTFETVVTDPDDSAYIIYISGTTGIPKGAEHAYRKLLGYILS